MTGFPGIDGYSGMMLVGQLAGIAAGAAAGVLPGLLFGAVFGFDLSTCVFYGMVAGVLVTAALFVRQRMVA